MIWTRNYTRTHRIIIISLGALVFLLGLFAGLLFRIEVAQAEEINASTSPEVHVTNIITPLPKVTVPVIIVTPTASSGGVPAQPAPVPSVQPSFPVEEYAASACTYLSGYLKQGWTNDATEVTKLQDFLRTQEGFATVASTGVYDDATTAAVTQFQQKYASEILAPWGVTDATGFVYITTKNKINELACGNPIPLTTTEQAVIASTLQNQAIGSVAMGDIGLAPAAHDDTTHSISTSTPAANGLVTIVNKDTLAEAPTKDAATTTAVASTQHHATSSIGGFSTWQNRVAATVLAVPGNTQDLYKAGANIILILAVLAIVWLILKEYVLYTKHVPSEERVGRTRLLFFAIGSFIAAVGMMFSATPFAVLPLLALAIILVVMIFAQGKTASMVSVGQAKHVPGSNQARNPMVPMKAQTSILAQNTDNKGAPQKAK